MAEQTIFKRYEIKYMLTRNQYLELKKEMAKYMIADIHGKNTNCSLYYDTPEHLLIRRSMEGPLYKEKLRLRSYGVAKADSKVYIELKKKFEGVVYKRRVEMTEEESTRYLVNGESGMDTQITREIDYCMERYHGLAPSCFLSYDREAYYGKDDHEFRMTFDENILWRDYDLNLHSGTYGEPILEPDQVLMEVKVLDHMPMWLVKFLSGNQIYKTSFSKFAKAYERMMEKPKETNRKGVNIKYA